MFPVGGGAADGVLGTQPAIISLTVRRLKFWPTHATNVNPPLSWSEQVGAWEERGHGWWTVQAGTGQGSMWPGPFQTTWKTSLGGLQVDGSRW